MDSKQLTAAERKVLEASKEQLLGIGWSWLRHLSDSELAELGAFPMDLPHDVNEMSSEDWTRLNAWMIASRIESHRDTEKWIRLAEVIAAKAHHGQCRKDGSPYITHPAHVASMVPEELKAIAWLHDAVEDSSLSLLALSKAGFPDYVTAAIDAITKRNGEEYEAYLQRVCANDHARRVKIADIEHNLGDQPSEQARTKYLRALPLLRGESDPNL